MQSQSVYAFLLALVLSLTLTPLVRAFARRVGALCYPNERSVHRSPVPYLGGVAIYIASASVIILFGGGDQAAKNATVIGGLLILIVGVIDDLLELRPWQKVLGQLVSAAVVMALGVSISFVTNPFASEIVNLGVASIPLTMLWVVSFENLINLSDGLDGLAAGVVAITATVMVFAARRAGSVAICPSAAAVAGATIGFLPYNFHPASIFMGDAGAMYLGLALSVLSVQGLAKSAVAMSVLVPILALLVPISDAAFAIIRRKFSGTSIARADHDHLHHRLLELGLDQRQAVLLIYLVSLGFGLLGLVSSFIPIAQGGPIAASAVIGLFAAARRAGLLTISSRKPHQGAGQR